MVALARLTVSVETRAEEVSQEKIVHQGQISRLLYESQTDACNHIVGVVLTQETEGVECPIAYASKKLNPQKQRLSIYSFYYLCIEKLWETFEDELTW
ncbi:hypothetical protein Y1Q_0008069 [Alligator mississippiensis]|uniref:Reverse transcriptase/retrotransposon-derived protein RNase H-like domain-containing protein n=1 Tax=Alligator mississippiensis TaxID=8496 RepID=A0A151NFE2_ALLMI|nr:hypothetical protein Y1Q_0008069 [Alligator mississippiensis]